MQQIGKRKLHNLKRKGNSRAHSSSTTKWDMVAINGAVFHGFMRHCEWSGRIGCKAWRQEDLEWGGLEVGYS
ncbi:hypothetical protein QQP08_022646 [Theobroma cacao]|nr:hypothetical protein QQP08_022646 [Theobroma cacao]